MEVEARVRQILNEAEQKLAALATELLKERDYSGMGQVSAIIERVAAAGAQPATTVLIGAGSEPKADQNLKESKASTYPHFFRDHDQLVKIGFSRSDQRTYEHRSPRSVLTRLTSLMVEITDNGRLFTTEQLLPPKAHQLTGVPTYQIYLCLAFLVRSNLVRRHGRAGYTAVDGANLSAAAEHNWQSLQTRT